MPTLILRGDDDQIVLMADSALLSSKIVKGSTLKVIPGAPHGMVSTLKNQINAELLAFFKQSQEADAWAFDGLESLCSSQVRGRASSGLSRWRSEHVRGFAVWVDLRQFSAGDRYRK